jgi:transposase-like protein
MDNQTTWNDDESQPVKQRKDPARKARAQHSHDLVFQMWEGGIRDFQEIASETGYTSTYVRMLLRERGYEVGSTVSHSKQVLDEACQAYKDGMKVRRVLKQWEISNNTLYAALEERSIPVRRTDITAKQGRAKFLDRAIEMYQQEFPLKEIHAETGIAASKLYDELALRNINTRSRVTVGNKALDEAVSMYQSKRTVADIEQITGVGSGRLYLELDVRGVEKHRGKGVHERISKAVEMFRAERSLSDIYKETRVGSSMLYRALKKAGVEQRRPKVKSSKHDLALKLYDRGVKGADILRQTQLSVSEMVTLLVKRGLNLRNGLPPKPTKRGLDLAIEMYGRGEPLESVEIETLIPRVNLLAELKNRKMEVRP